MIYPRLSDGTVDWCVMCKHEGRDLYDGCCECEYPENSDDPPAKYEPKPMTNGDKLRAMSDEELADWLVMNGNGEDYKTWLGWLREETQNGRLQNRDYPALCRGQRPVLGVRGTRRVPDVGGQRMKNVWAYWPDVCDGDWCPMDCDHCPKCEEALEADPDWSPDWSKDDD